jgi:site-specific DNA-adenine methylase
MKTSNISNYAAGKYLGRKGASGVPQWIINKFPKHDVYIEGFFGTGTIGLSKLAASIANIGYERSQKVFTDLSMLEHNFELFNDCIFNLLRYHIDKYNDGRRSIVIYLDPPYLAHTRNDYAGSQYEYEFSISDHEQLLFLMLEYRQFDNVKFIISGYKSELYMSMLHGWSYFEFKTMTRGGPSIESLWCSFNPDFFEKHQYDYVGRDFTDRQRIKRKCNRYLKKFDDMPNDERLFILRSLIDKYDYSGSN